jgi:hypothetical protein
MASYYTKLNTPCNIIYKTSRLGHHLAGLEVQLVQFLSRFLGLRVGVSVCVKRAGHQATKNEVRELRASWSLTE